MTVITSTKYGAGFSSTMTTGQKLAQSGLTTAIKAISVGAFQPATIITNSAFSALVAATNNCRYVSATEISLDEAADTTLDVVNVAQSSCTVQFEWEDDISSTVLSNIRFYAFNKVNPAIAPPNATVVAFEHDGTNINKNRVADLTGLAWNAASGIGGSANALEVPDRVSATLHRFFIGISLRVETFGTNTEIAYRIEFDVT